MGGEGSKIEDQRVLKEGIIRLWHGDDLDPTDQWWENFYTLPVSAQDVFNTVRLNDLRRLTASDPPPAPGAQVAPTKNLETLIYNVIARLETVISGQLHQTMSIHHINGQILNCMRLLTRIIPAIYECPHLRDWHDRFFWQNRRPAYLYDQKTNKPGRLFDGLDPTKRYDAEHMDVNIGPPLGQTLMDIVVKLFFFPSFAVPKRVHEDGSLNLEFHIKLWQSGIGSSSTNDPSTRENELHQAEITRLLLAMSSMTLYLHSNEVASTEIKALTYLTTQLEKQALHGILCSLLNVIMKYNPYTWSIPMDLSDLKSDPKKALVSSSLQFLLVVVVYRLPSYHDVGKNAFHQAISKLHKKADLQFIHQGMDTVLRGPVSSPIPIPGAGDRVPAWSPETISLLWELFQNNKYWRRYLIESNIALDYVVLLVWFAMDAKDNEAKQGVLRMCVFVLQDLSAQPDFAEKLNMALRSPEALPSIVRPTNFRGSYGDFLICSIHALFAASQSGGSMVVDALLTILTNISPSLQGLSRPTSKKVLDLLYELSSPVVLLAGPTNHEQLSKVLRAADAIVRNHYEENPKFIQVVVASGGRFKALHALTLDSLLAQADRSARERKDRGEGVAGAGANAPTPSRPTSSDRVRNPTAARAPSLDGVPEESTFSIGEDDDDEDDSDTPRPGTSKQTTGAAMSDKARGKQPAAVASSASRSSSMASMMRSNTNTSTSDTNQTMTQTRSSPQRQAWFDTWHPRLPLQTLLKIIRCHETYAQTGKPVDPASFASATANEPSTEDQRRESFQWTPAAVGWYNALIWSRIYLHEAETFQGAGGLYASTDVKLFRRAAGNQQISLLSPRGAIDAVGASLAQRISNFSIK